MEKIRIAGLYNGKTDMYVELVVKKQIMKVIKQIVNELDKTNYTFEEEDAFPLYLSNYNKWKDKTIRVSTKGFQSVLICGDKHIHWVIYDIKNKRIIDEILDKYCVWSKSKKK